MLRGREVIDGRMLERGWDRAGSRQLAVLMLAMTAAVKTLRCADERGWSGRGEML